MLISIEDIVDEAIDDRRFANGLIAKEYYLVFEEWRNGALAEVQVADVGHICCLNNRNINIQKKNIKILLEPYPLFHTKDPTIVGVQIKIDLHLSILKDSLQRFYIFING